LVIAAAMFDFAPAHIVGISFLADGVGSSASAE
jgi:hypothetical protein